MGLLERCLVPDSTTASLRHVAQVLADAEIEIPLLVTSVKE
jgi:hypothetical protein